MYIRINLINLLFCAAILILSFLAYRKSKGNIYLYVAGAFGLFGISHVLSILGLDQGVFILMVILRVVAYLFVIFALLETIRR